MKFLSFLFIIGFLFFISIFLFGFSALRMMFKFLFGINPQVRNVSSNQQKTKQKQKQTNKQPKPSPSQKIFTSDEGEYVDFEEVKDS